MHQRIAQRLLAIVAGLTLTTAASAYAQDTSQTGGATTDTVAPSAGALDTTLSDTSAVGDSSDTSGVQNPPGYQGMERDTTLVPPGATTDSSGADSTRLGTDSASSSGVQNPPGYQGMERDTTLVPSEATGGSAAGDSARITADSTQ